VAALSLHPHQRGAEGVVGHGAEHEHPAEHQAHAADHRDGAGQRRGPVEAAAVERHQGDPQQEADRHRVHEPSIAPALAAGAGHAVALGEERRVAPREPPAGAGPTPTIQPLRIQPGIQRRSPARVTIRTGQQNR